MNLLFEQKARDDYLHWQETDKKLLRRIHELLKAIAREPFFGIGKPEPLKPAYAGYWSRRITDEHRLVYKVEGPLIKIAQLRYHYR
jgi:toxin YoeB